MLLLPGGWLVAGLAAVRTAWLWVPLGVLLGLASRALRKRFRPWASGLIGGLLGCLLGHVLWVVFYSYAHPETFWWQITVALPLPLPVMSYVGLWSAPYFYLVARRGEERRGAGP